MTGPTVWGVRNPAPQSPISEVDGFAPGPGGRTQPPPRTFTIHPPLDPRLHTSRPRTHPKPKYLRGPGRADRKSAAERRPSRAEAATQVEAAALGGRAGGRARGLRSRPPEPRGSAGAGRVPAAHLRGSAACLRAAPRRPCVPGAGSAKG